MRSRAQLDYKGTVAVAPASNLGFILIAGERSVANTTLDKRSQCMLNLTLIQL